jgi:hypothetical protein
MGYVEKIMGDNEYALHMTHQHLLVLLERALGVLFAFVVFFGSGLAVLLSKPGDLGDRFRFTIGLIVLGSLVMPLYLVVLPWTRDQRGHDYLRQIWRPALAGLVILAIALIMMIWPGLQYIGWIAVAVSLVPLVELVRHVLDWSNERYIITNRRVMEVRGIINKHVRDSALEKVNDVELEQSIAGRILGYGTVQIITGSDIGVNMFRRISDPVRFKRAMLNAKEQLQEAESPLKVDEQTTPLPPTLAAKRTASDLELSSKADIPALIAELAELHQKGIITDEEFQTKKADLLARL